MDLQRLRWTKSITPQRGEPWDYDKYDKNRFDLYWKNGKTNASKLEQEDLILLTQKGFVTHLVEVLDYKLPEHKIDRGEFNIYRSVKVLWVTDWKNPSLAKADKVFDYSEVLKYQGGKVMKLEKITSRHWESKGGFAAFQNHVHSQLNLE